MAYPANIPIKTVRLIRLFLFVLMAPSLVACSSSLEFENRNFEDLYSLDIETSMVNVGDNDPLANVEYGNEFKEFYFKVIHEDIGEYREKTILHHLEDPELMRHYLEAAKEDYLEYMSAPTWLGEESRLVNMMPCVIHELSTDGNGFPIRYKIAYYMSEERFYQLHIWTMESRLERFAEGIDQMINSFKEV